MTCGLSSVCGMVYHLFTTSCCCFFTQTHLAFRNDDDDDHDDHDDHDDDDDDDDDDAER